MTDEELLARAEAMLARSYAPYSEFRVGAALLASDGTVIGGCNVENAAYGPTICAERTAVVAAVAAGHQRFDTIAVVGPEGHPITPCGVCRQVLWEFAPELRVVTTGPVVRQLADLLPDAFGPDRLHGD